MRVLRATRLERSCAWQDREYLGLSIGTASRAADSADSGIRACSQRAKSERGHPRGRPTGTFLLVGAGSGSSTWCSTSGSEHLAFTYVWALSPSSMAPSSIRPVVLRHHSPMGGWNRRPLG